MPVMSLENLDLLEHLCTAGIPVSLLKVFSTADCLECVGLKHLALNSPNFVSGTNLEFTAVLHSNISSFIFLRSLTLTSRQLLFSVYATF